MTRTYACLAAALAVLFAAPAAAATVNAYTQVHWNGGEVPRTDPNGKPLTTTSAHWLSRITITAATAPVKDIEIEYKLVGQTWGSASRNLVMFDDVAVPNPTPNQPPINTWKVVSRSVTSEGAKAKWELDQIGGAYPGALGVNGAVTLQAILPKSSKLQIGVIEFSFTDGSSQVLAAEFVDPVPLPGGAALLAGGLAMGLFAARRRGARAT